eukprot:TRINITY_DN66116_c3_g2_i1.p1 TRINITY_DN66116_c3_g2~~TRINITY_DN66116_c3_g2_i1.p1  ORF type:complete len:560 (+),score=267.12 TRINITY_DN66116_c3_g2_i1:160-1680(+)
MTIDHINKMFYIVLRLLYCGEQIVAPRIQNSVWPPQHPQADFLAVAAAGRTRGGTTDSVSSQAAASSTTSSRTDSMSSPEPHTSPRTHLALQRSPRGSDGPQQLARKNSMSSLASSGSTALSSSGSAKRGFTVALPKDSLFRKHVLAIRAGRVASYAALLDMVKARAERLGEWIAQTGYSRRDVHQRSVAPRGSSTTYLPTPTATPKSRPMRLSRLSVGTADVDCGGSPTFCDSTEHALPLRMGADEELLLDQWMLRLRIDLLRPHITALSADIPSASRHRRHRSFDARQDVAIAQLQERRQQQLQQQLQQPPPQQQQQQQQQQPHHYQQQHQQLPMPIGHRPPPLHVPTNPVTLMVSQQVQQSQHAMPQPMAASIYGYVSPMSPHQQQLILQQQQRQGSPIPAMAGMPAPLSPSQRQQMFQMTQQQHQQYQQRSHQSHSRKKMIVQHVQAQSRRSSVASVATANSARANGDSKSTKSPPHDGKRSGDRTLTYAQRLKQQQQQKSS